MRMAPARFVGSRLFVASLVAVTSASLAACGGASHVAPIGPPPEYETPDAPVSVGPAPSASSTSPATATTPAPTASP